MHTQRLMKILRAERYLPQFPANTAVMAAWLCVICAGCLPQADRSAQFPTHLLRMVDLTSPPSPIVTDGPINLAAAGNEWTDFVVQVDSANAAAIRLGE